MSEHADYLFALALQKQYNEENNQRDGYPQKDDDIKFVSDGDEDFKSSKRISKYSDNQDEDFLNRTQNLVHPEWEVLDPTPDIFAMFKRFNQKFFGSRLECVTLEWSKRMYSCAGICYQRRNRLGMDVTVRLSEPLLKLRPRKDLVETMLHEMIHAYCFVLNIREGNGGHGPNFKKIMNAINKVAGTNITVYHTFNDEVDLYKQHWWRCNGICQNRTPFFGYVKRTSNRAPGPYDQWWEQHVRSCGGTFMKIKEPDPKPKQQKKSITSNKIKINVGGGSETDIKKFFTSKNITKDEPITKSNNNKDTFINANTMPTKKDQSNQIHTLLTSATGSFPPTSYSKSIQNIPTDLNLSNSKTKIIPSGNLKNVISFGDLNATSITGSTEKNTVLNRNSQSYNTENSGRGYVLNDNFKNVAVAISSENNVVDRNHLRNVWSNRFCDNSNKPKPIDSTLDLTQNDKHDLIPNDEKVKKSDDADVIIIEDKNNIIELLSDSDEEETFLSPPPQIPRKDRQDMIKKEIMDESQLELSFEDVILIDDEYDDNEAAILAATELADTSLIDEFFGEDTLMAEFQRENDVVPSGSRYHRNADNDIITCAVCLSKMKRSLLKEHLDGCMGIINKISAPKFGPKNTAKDRRSRSTRNTDNDVPKKRKRNF